MRYLLLFAMLVTYSCGEDNPHMIRDCNKVLESIDLGPYPLPETGFEDYYISQIDNDTWLYMSKDRQTCYYFTQSLRTIP